MTIEEIRRALSFSMGQKKVQERCPKCHGQGHIERVVQQAVTQTEVAEAIGTTRSSVNAFLHGKQTFGMEVTLRLLKWLEDREDEAATDNVEGAEA